MNVIKDKEEISEGDMLYNLDKKDIDDIQYNHDINNLIFLNKSD